MASKIVSLIKLMSGAFDLEDSCEVRQAIHKIMLDHQQAILEAVKRIETKVDNHVFVRVAAAELALEAYFATDLSVEHRKDRMNQAISHLEYVYSCCCKEQALAKVEATALYAVLLCILYSVLGSKSLREVWLDRAVTAFETWDESIQDRIKSLEKEAKGKAKGGERREFQKGVLDVLSEANPAVKPIVVALKAMFLFVPPEDSASSKEEIKKFQTMEQQVRDDLHELKALRS
ncbi:MAG: hypothetical protein EAZ74_04160 [Alphaproteobacteria bacterium]|nr:MAG: hypothetical protein EAY76_02670 [Alphaproteobacteria bacterium]TAF14380.1 MAG: hypothetical protein EAZ74_04160 [Alphaproteobacteria bacterium]TAF41470.1 MAG: hypothetical protein EAZ66_01295 [Alphaproteobacteria bacterium]TAF75720.1 MAG: hypothetical protein EAZ52_06020 [Alphaproteobacteria bacterium]